MQQDKENATAADLREKYRDILQSRGVQNFIKDYGCQGCCGCEDLSSLKESPEDEKAYLERASRVVKAFTPQTQDNVLTRSGKGPAEGALNMTLNPKTGEYYWPDAPSAKSSKGHLKQSTAG